MEKSWKDRNPIPITFPYIQTLTREVYDGRVTDIHVQKNYAEPYLVKVILKNT